MKTITKQTIGKPFLVRMDTQAGVQYQIWYEDNKQAVGCAGLSFLSKTELPDRDMPWNVEDAIAHVARDAKNAAEAEARGG